MPDIREMVGKEVEVIANGMVYRGKLIEVSESEVYIRTLLQSIALPASSVTEIKLAESRIKGGLGTTFPIEESTEEIEEIHEIEELEDPGTESFPRETGS